MKAARRKRRSRPSLKTRLRTFWLAGLAVAGLTVWGAWTLATLPALKMKSLSVTGLDRVSRADVLARARLDPSANVWLLDRAAIERRIDASPYVLDARLHVRPVANLWIEVAERVPDACVRDAAGREVTIDRASRVLQDTCAVPLPLTYVVRSRLDALPGAFLNDGELAALQRDARALGSDGDRFRSFSHDGFGQLEATMHDGIAVLFGDDGDLAQKQRLIGPILAQLGPRAGAVRAVDLRAVATPVVEYRR